MAMTSGPAEADLKVELEQLLHPRPIRQRKLSLKNELQLSGTDIRGIDVNFVGFPDCFKALMIRGRTNVMFMDPGLPRSNDMVDYHQ